MIPERILLASKSPRRQELIKGLGWAYDVVSIDVDEDFPTSLHAQDIPLFLSEKKAKAWTLPLLDGDVLLTADTIVWIHNTVLNKPENEEDAFRMLRMICGHKHEVFTGVCLTTSQKQHVFYERTEVFCRNLTDEEIRYYIRHFKPFDKAGSYGIQDWFGYTAVERIQGCFYNVMGLPVSRLYKELRFF